MPGGGARQGRNRRVRWHGCRQLDPPRVPAALASGRLCPDRLKGPNPMEPDRTTPSDAETSSWQPFARIALATTVIAVGLWILFDFLPALAWAAVLAIALWPLYHRMLRLLPERCERLVGPLLGTAVIGIVFIA